MLKISKTINPKDWMQDEASQIVMNCLNQDFDGFGVFFVGGCVRNSLLNKDVQDIDIATILLPDEVIAKLEGNHIKVIPTGVDHGTVTAVFDTHNFEITTLRKDIKTDGRHAVVEFGSDWFEDAKRRDFTMNTLLMDMDGNIYDPTGRGIADLEARRVVFVGNPPERIAEDYLRILRFFRFHAYYGGGDPDADALEACRDAADQIGNLSKERITQEFLKILVADRAVETLELMFDCGVLNELKGAVYDAAQFLCFCQLQNDSSWDVSTDFRKVEQEIARLYFVTAGSNEAVMRYLRLSGKQQKLLSLYEGQSARLHDLDEKTVKILIYRQGNEVAEQLVLIYAARHDVDAAQALDICQNWQVPEFPLTGDDLIKQGHKPGPELGALLRQKEDEWLEALFG